MSAGSHYSPQAMAGKSSVFDVIQYWHLVDNGAAVRLLAGHKYGAGRLVGHHVCDVNYTVAVPGWICVLESVLDIYVTWIDK